MPCVTTAAIRPKPTSTSPCPCGSGKALAECCEPLLKQERQAKTPGELMRSRFTAHVLRDYRHLHRTYLGTVREAYKDPVDEAAVDWTRLVIHSEEPGAKDGTAFVDFTAFYDEAGSEHAHHEKAEFVRHDGSWIYSRAVRTGPTPLKSTTPKVGRNDPCRCGSGKKFKHCCGR